ncbi:MAG: POTRA domain-containing protein [Terriglobales bacterium]
MVSASLLLGAQTPQATAPYALFQGRPVASIVLAGRPGLNPTPLLAALPQQKGEPLDQAKVEQSLTVLRQKLGPGVTGIQVDILPELTGVRLEFLLQPAAYFGIYQFPGALRFSYTRLLEAAHFTNQAPYTAEAVQAAVAGLQNYFRQEGYFQARVAPTLHTDSAHLITNVVFKTTLGPRARFGTVTFTGATAAEARQMQDSLASWWARLRRKSITPGSVYSRQRLDVAAAYLQSQLSDEGFLGARITPRGADYHPATNRADITFEVRPGPKVALAVTGAFLWPWTRHTLLPFRSENRVGPEAVQDGQQDLTDYLASKGYFHAVVTTKVSTTAANGATEHHQTQASAESLAPPTPPPPPPATPVTHKSITYEIAKGPRRDVEEIHFTGNKFYANSDLLSVLKIKPEGLLFSHGSFSAQLLRQSVDNIESLYKSSGYAAVQVTPVVTHPGGNLAVTFQITEGPQDFVASLNIEGNTVGTAQLAPLGLNIGAGTPFSEVLISDDRSQILAWYLSHGYLNATFRATASPVAGKPHQMNVVYNISEGPQIHVSKVLIYGEQHTNPRLIRLLTSALSGVPRPSTSPGAVLTENDLLTAESRLYSPGIFDWAQVAPRAPITTQTQADVLVKVHEAARNSLVYGFGFDVTNRGGSIPSGTVALPGLPVVGLPSNFVTSQATFFGPTVNAEYTRLNVGGKAGTLSFGGFAGRLDQHGSITFTDPRLWWSKFTGSLVASGEHDSQNPIFTSRIAQIGYQLERPLNPDHTTNLFLRYSLSQTGLSRLLIPDLVPARDRHVRLSMLSATYLRDTRDNPLDAHKGILESYEIDFNSTALGSSVDFAKLLTQTAYYRSMNLLGQPGVVWANSLRLGYERAFSGSFIPLSQAFFSGGGSSLRGFPLDGAGPQKTIPACGNPSDPSTCTLINVPVGGSALLIFNSELRIPTPEIWKNLGVALFYDGGNVFESVGLASLGASYTNTIGIGLRYQTAVGPIRIDLGHNLNAVPGVQATQYFITLGQAF